MGLVMVRRWKHNTELSVVEIAVAKLNQVLIKFQYWFKEKMKYYILSSMNSLTLFGIWKDCLSSRRNILYQFTNKDSK
jgi:hypothetical protein